MTMKPLRKMAARLPEAATRPLAHAVMALGPVAMCGAGGAKPESWWLPAGFLATVIAIQWAWRSGRDRGRGEAYHAAFNVAASDGTIEFSLVPSREQQEWYAAAKAATAALREIAERDHSGDVNKMVPDHVPDAGKKEKPHV